MSRWFGVSDRRRWLASLDESDLIAGRVEADLVHEGADQQQATAADPAEVGGVGRIWQP
jgi:hypothetical protein